MRLIDADALMEEYRKIQMASIKMQFVCITEVAIDNAPTVDAVPVTRCRDCRYYQDNNGGYPNADCKWCKDETPDANDYCSCGERKDND